MLTFDGPFEAKTALVDFLIDRTAALPEKLRDELRATLRLPSPVDTVCQAAELIYTSQSIDGGLAREILDWAAATSVMAEANGMHQLAEDSRGSRMATVMRGGKIAAAKVPAALESMVKRINPPTEEAPPEARAAPDWPNAMPIEGPPNITVVPPVDAQARPLPIAVIPSAE